jgi:hypothetical protein
MVDVASNRGLLEFAELILKACYVCLIGALLVSIGISVQLPLLAGMVVEEGMCFPFPH